MLKRYTARISLSLVQFLVFLNIVLCFFVFYYIFCLTMILFCSDLHFKEVNCYMLACKALYCKWPLGRNAEKIWFDKTFVLCSDESCSQFTLPDMTQLDGRVVLCRAV